MDQLETQVSDLRSFLGAAAVPQGPDGVQQVAAANASVSPHNYPLRASLSVSGRDNSAHLDDPQSPPVGANAFAGSAKRRAEDADDGPAKQQRSKRNRYISIACNECKRRKIKCNGQTPCQRCGHLNLQCLYSPNCCANFKDSDEFREMADHVRQLQEQVESLFSSMTSLRQETARLAPLQDRVLPPPSAAATPSSSSSGNLQRPALPFRVPSFFNGPTSMAFTVDVAKNTLHKMGYSGAGDGNEDGAQPDPTPHASPFLAPTHSGSLAQGPADPIWEFDEPEMMRLLQVYQEEVDVMYPVASVGPVVEHIKYVAAWMDTARRTGVVSPPALEQIILDPRTLLLKIILCCALVVAEHGNSEKAVRVYDSLQPTVDKMLMSNPADVTKLSFLALCAGYRYLSNDEVLAWRLIGQVARLCFELGLHRREGLQRIADPQTRRDALYTFWSAYVLDRRWSFSTGLPFVCHDDKIDPKLPYPEGYPFLVAMIGYSRLGAKIWKHVDCFEPTIIRELKPRDFEELDREIMEWYESLPEEIRSDPLDGDKMSVPSGPYDLQRLRIWTRLRLNQVRIWLYTPVLHSATCISENAQLARNVVDLAKQTIRLLAHLNNQTDLYRRIQVFYHQFLTSSIAVLFLASTHAPLRFSAVCRDEFYMALDLVKEMSARSWVSHRLWRTIRSLRAYAPKLGLGDSGNVNATRGAVLGASTSPSPYARASGGSAGHSPGGMVAGAFGGGGGGGAAVASRSGSRASSAAATAGVTSPSGAAVASRSGSRASSAAATAGVTSPSGAAVATAAAALTPGTTAQPMQLDDPLSNGLRLQSEMSRIYEGYTGGMTGGVTGPAVAASGGMGYGGGRGGGLGVAGLGGGGGEGFPKEGDGGGLFQHMKGML